MKNKYLVGSRRYERQEPLRDSRKIYIYCEGNKRGSSDISSDATVTQNV